MPPLAILNGIDVRRRARFRGREGDGLRGSKSKREMDEAAPLKGPWTLHDSSRPAGPGWGSEAIWQVRKHGLTGVLGFGKRFRG